MFYFTDIAVTYLKWIYSEDSDSLLVGSKTPTGCFIELWGLMEKSTPIHSHFKHLFQQPNKTEVFKTYVSVVFFCRCEIELNCHIVNKYIELSSDFYHPIRYGHIK